MGQEVGVASAVREGAHGHLEEEYAVAAADQGRTGLSIRPDDGSQLADITAATANLSLKPNPFKFTKKDAVSTSDPLSMI